MNNWTIGVWDPSGTGVFGAATSFPAPDTEPYTPAVISTAQFFRNVRGLQVGIQPIEKLIESPMTFVWSRISGSSLKDQIREYIQSGAGLQITPSTGDPFSGVFIEMLPAARAGYEDDPPWSTRGTLWDIRATFQPQNLASGS